MHDDVEYPMGTPTFARPTLLNSCAMAATAAEASFRVPYPNSMTRQSRIIALDERGRDLSSAQLAQQLTQWQQEGRDVTFVIGGADGLDPDFVKRADLVLSFSPLTWPHQMVRIMLAEQLYRTTTILSGHPYHRGD